MLAKLSPTPGVEKEEDPGVREEWRAEGRGQRAEGWARDLTWTLTHLNHFTCKRLSNVVWTEPCPWPSQNGAALLPRTAFPVECSGVVGEF